MITIIYDLLQVKSPGQGGLQVLPVTRSERDLGLPSRALPHSPHPWSILPGGNPSPRPTLGTRVLEPGRRGLSFTQPHKDQVRSGRVPGFLGEELDAKTLDMCLELG